MMSDPQPKRLYQAWKGSNKFFCGGRLIFGPDASSVLLTTFLIATPAIVFCCQVISKIAHHAKSVNHNRNILGIPVLIAAVILTILDLIFLYITSGRDPGIVPRNSRPIESEEACDDNNSSMEWVNGRTQARVPRTKDVVVNGIAVKVKYCDTCYLYRPARASHCSICNNCVQKFDHHCPWVGQCIGLRNYRFFLLFISTSSFLCLYVFIFSWLNIFEQKKHLLSMWKAIKQEIISLILIIYTFIAIWFVGGLTVFHLYLISSNQTTYENFRYRYDKKENPYNKGLLRNFEEVFFSRIPHSKNDFRSWVFEEPHENGNDMSGFANVMTGSDFRNEKVVHDVVIKINGSNAAPHMLQKWDSYPTNYDTENGSIHFESATDPNSNPANQECPTQEPKSCKENFRQGLGTTVIFQLESGPATHFTASPVTTDDNFSQKQEDIENQLPVKGSMTSSVDNNREGCGD